MLFVLFNLHREIKHTMIALLMATLLLGVCACTSIHADQSEKDNLTWQEQYDLGVRYLSEGNYEEAIIAFTAAIEIDPNQTLAYVGRGDAYIASGETTENLAAARSDYEMAIELDATEAELYRKVAEIYERQGNLEDAIEWLERGVEITGDQSLQEHLNWLLEELPPKYVMTRQDFYDGTGSEHYYDIYTYDEQGYLITWDSWFWGGVSGMEDWYNSRNVTWHYDLGKQIWIKTETITPVRQTGREDEVKKEEVVDRKPGTVQGNYIGAASFQEGYAIGAVYEADLDFDTEGHTALYTYDENGNAVRIDTYAPDGTLSGWCILTWEELGTIG